jgi:membrane-bound serine protease (ClpP class)
MSFAALVVLLLVLGFALLAIEILVIPGFGVVGVLGCVSLLSGGVVAWRHLGPTQGVLAFAGGLVVSGLMVWIFPKTSAGQALVLKEAHHGISAAPGLEELVGRVGVASTPLRPSGTIAVGDRTLDVVTDGVYVEPGTKVRVARVEGARVLVEPVGDS